MSDQYGNKVDGEIWIDQVVQYGTKDGSQKPKPLPIPMPVPLKTWREWAIAYADGSVDDVRYEDEGEARQNLQVMRQELRSYGVPEEYWPAMMERTVETVATSWRILSV